MWCWGYGGVAGVRWRARVCARTRSGAGKRHGRGDGVRGPQGRRGWQGGAHHRQGLDAHGVRADCAPCLEHCDGRVAASFYMISITRFDAERRCPPDCHLADTTKGDDPGGRQAELPGLQPHGTAGETLSGVHESHTTCNMGRVAGAWLALGGGRWQRYCSTQRNNEARKSIGTNWL